MTEEEAISAFDDAILGLDGKWSSQTKALIAQHGAKNLELNKWWALTRQNWECPSCGKPKRDLARLNQSKCLIAKLVSHHDHANEWVEKYAEVVWLSNGSREPIARALRDHLKRIAKGFLSRFHPTVICEACNNSEPNIKRRLDIPDCVTLRPNEIGLLKDYDRNPRQEQLEYLVVKLTEWAGFIRRHLALAQESFCAEIHSMENTYLLSAEKTRSQAVRTLESKFGSPAQENMNLESEFLAASESSVDKPHQEPSVLPWPTREQYLNYRHPDPLRQRVIDSTPEDWACPICSRTKFQCFRSKPASKKEFQLNLFAKVLTAPEGDGEVEVTICGDCNRFHQELLGHCEKIGFIEIRHLRESGKIDAGAIKWGIVALPHQRHQQNFDRAIAYIKGPDFQNHDGLVDF